MRAARLVGPVAGAAEGEGRAMPCDRYAVLELGAILRVDFGPIFDRALDALGRRHGGELVRVRPAERVGAEQHALPAGVEAAARIGNLPDRQIGVRDPAEDMLVLLPE